MLPSGAGWVGGVGRLSLDGHPSPRPAIPGGLLSSRARFRFAGRVNHRRLLSVCQEFFRVIAASGLRPTGGSGFAGLGELSVARGPEALGPALERVREQGAWPLAKTQRTKHV